MPNFGGAWTPSPLWYNMKGPAVIVEKKDRQKGINIRFTMDLADLVILLSTTKLLDRTLVANLGFPQWIMTSNLGIPISHFLVTYLLCNIFWIYTFVVSSLRVMPSTSMPSPSAHCDGPRTTRSPIAHVPRPPRDHRS